MGVAVQSHWFSVGSVVSWGEAGVGVVATQAFVDAGYGPKGLALMARGVEPSAALSRLLAKDSRPEIRQVALLDARGRVAGHTGKGCLPYAGGTQGEGFSVQANLMASPGVWPAMARSFRASKGPLAQRLLRALEAAEGAGGDRRGRQSAAILVVSTRPTKEKWRGKLVDLRVEDHPAPLKEMKRLLSVSDAYGHANRGDELVAEKKFRQALREYALASEAAPSMDELKFWQGATLLDAGKVDQAARVLGEAFRAREDWRTLLRLLPKYGLLHVRPEVLESVLGSN